MLTLFFLKLTYVSKKKKNGVKIEPVTWPKGRLPIYVLALGLQRKKSRSQHVISAVNIGNIYFNLKIHV